MEEKKDNRGKKRIFETDKDFKEKFYQYIKLCKADRDLPNIAGFCVFMSMHRGTFYDQKEFYPDTFKEIQEILEDSAINCKGINDTFKIFYMKNKFDYRDKQENINIETSYENYLKNVEDDEEY
jgi:hypothetical protein